MSQGIVVQDCILESTDEIYEEIIEQGLLEMAEKLKEKGKTPEGISGQLDISCGQQEMLQTT